MSDARTFLIYVENARDAEPVHRIDVASIRESANQISPWIDVVEAKTDAPNIQSLEKATFFIGGQIDKERLKRHAKQLAIVHSLNAGVEKLMPLDWLLDSAVLTNSRGIHGTRAGEFSMTALLMLNNRAPHYASLQRDRSWQRTFCDPIRGKVVMIFGVGSLGGAAAEAAKRIGLQVWGVRRDGAPHPAVDRMYTPADFRGALTEVDFLLLSCPLTPETRRVIGALELGRLRPGAGLVNISRGDVIDEDALVDSLRRGHLSGAVLDVFQREPLPADSELWDVPNLTIFPHVSSDSSVGYTAASSAIFLENVARWLGGQPLRNVVSPSRGY
ncbi:D-2-hydroxyacid dehydrogenase [Bosea sp. (in: a-proteobacteria)]|jgi:phosphoglycerate dehydrogenase-like enzyme|uniref:D-2-hydroxyacid dehydrogenase n=1 Tax=Bosea sp. (in: a-proteobacteria) TaxID=1871050 RepID=UPI002DDD9524|nr:D-2-hydroxyacid dehydrogenase [Bosea sp. (in: a-proteobacteria)]HEV2510266.1 D-2-hydroxyacid dehydrogenase [Bosea sp. (in: a-proteobacteria)]